MRIAALRATVIVLLSLFGRDSALASDCPTPTFVAAGTFRAGNQPASALAGDFNSDGKPDLAVVNQFSANVTVLIGNGDGTFQGAVNYSAGSGPASAVVRDFNGDGRLDVAVTDVGTTNIWVLLGNADGTFQPSVSYPVQNLSQSIASGDFNGDARADLAVAIRVDGAISVLLGNGNGSFQSPASYPTGPDPFSVAVGDFNGDGARDLAVANAALFEDPPAVSILLGRGNGLFRAAIYYEAGTSPRSVAVGDFNRDNRPDLAVANYGSFVGSQFTNSSISVLLGNGDGTFQAPVDYRAGEAPLSLAATDLNGDGSPDVAVANYRSRTVSILFGNGDGTLRAPADYAAGFNPRWVEAGDFNRDSQPDLAVVNDGGVLVLLGTCVSAADLVITRIDAPGPVAAGSNLTYTLSVTNSGPDSASDVSLTDLLPAGVIFVAATSSQGSCTHNAGTITCSLGEMANATQRTITLTVTAPAAGSLTNTATVSSSATSDPNTSNNSATAVTTVLPLVSILTTDSAASEAGPDSGLFTVRRAGGTTGGLTVHYTVAGTASNGGDYVTVSGSATIPNGSASATITVTPVDDPAVEPTETVTVLLAPHSSYVIDSSGDRATLDILDNDLPALSINDVAVTEGNAGTVDAVFTVRLSSPTTQTVTVNFLTASGTAVAGTDFATATGTLTFGPGTTNRSVTVSVLGDALVEPSETFAVVLSNPTSATIADGQGIGTIVNDDSPLPSLLISDVAVTEGNTGSTNAVFLVRLSAPSAQTVAVSFATADGTGSAASDYVATNGLLSFPPGITNRDLIVRVNGDGLDEADETFLLVLSNPSSAVIADSQGIGTIADDDPLPSLSISNSTMTEGNSGSTNSVFAATLSTASGRNVTVEFASANGTAEAESDYTSTNGTLTFTPGVTTLTIGVEVNGDLLHEANETFSVDLFNPVNAVIDDNRGIATILDDDVALPSLSISDLTVTEGNSGSTNAILIVSLSAPSTQTVAVIFGTTDGTGNAGTDYVATNGLLSFPPGTTNRELIVRVNGDLIHEANETFVVNLSNPINATLADDQAMVTINDNDVMSVLTINDVTLTEGNSGATSALFPVRLQPPSGQTVTVNFATADGTATASNDYIPTNGVVTFTPGTTNQTVAVAVRGDLVNESNETFFVNLTNPRNATLGDSQGAGSVNNDDPVVGIAISDAVVFEGNSGSTNATFRVSLSAVSERLVTVNYATAHDTTVGNDYGATSGTLRFDAGQTNQVINVAVDGDTRTEDNETFFVNLSVPLNATLVDNQGVGTILNDEGVPSISLTDVSVVEGDLGTTNAVFTVRLTATYAREVTLSYATADGSTVAGVDYVATNGVVNFPPGTIAQTAVVRVIGDRRNELNETFFVNLFGSTNALINDSRGAGTISNDDPLPVLFINDLAVNEGDAAGTNAVFSVRLSAASGQTVAVNFATAAGTAGPDLDYASTNGTLIFVEGITNQPITVTTLGDVLNEEDEDFAVILSGAVNATIGDSQGAGRIANDDPLPALSVASVAVNEGDGGTVLAAFAVRLSAPSGRRVTVDYATADGTARAVSDYVPVTGSLSFGPGETIQTVAVAVSGDLLNEPNETFLVSLDNPINAVLGDRQGIGTINNDDPLPTLSINDLSVTEADMGTTNAVFVVRLSTASGQTVLVGFATSNATAAAGFDYVATNGTLTFAPGTTSQLITVIVNNDPLNETDERFFVNLGAPVNGILANGQGVGTIRNDDPLPAISIVDLMADEANSGTTDAVFTVRLSPVSGQAVTIEFATADGTAKAGADYVSVTGTLSIPAGTTTQAVTVAILGDLLNEANETLFLNLSSPANATLADTQAVGTIRNDDPLPSLSIDNQTVTEADSGNPSAPFTIRLAVASGQTVTVGYATADGTANVGTDYLAINGTVTFAPGTTTQIVAIAILGDVLFEANETFFVNLSSPINAVLGDGQGMGTINNNDPMPVLAINDVTVTEGNSGATNAVFTVRLLSLGGQPVTVNFATADGTAAASSDYIPTNGTLTFNPGTTNRTIAVAVKGDLINESNETFFVHLANAGNATIGDSQGAGTINDNDPVVAIAISDAVLFEGNSGSVDAVFRVSLTAISGRLVTVNYATANGSTVGNDFDNTSGTLGFDPGETNQFIHVPVEGDNRAEDNETFLVNLTAPLNATLADSQGVGTILNDDRVPAVSITDGSVVEGDLGANSAVFTARLTETYAAEVTLSYATADGTAAAGADYLATNGVVRFAPGTTDQTITVRVIADRVHEVNETFFVNLSASTNALITDVQGVGTILDNDPLTFLLSTNSLRVSEGATSVLTVRLITAPLSNIVVTADRTGGSTDLGVSRGSILTFTPTDWNVAQTIAITATEDEDTSDDHANFTVFSAGSGQIINATGLDNDLQNLTRCPGNSALFSTTPSGSGPFSYLWRKDGQPVLGQTNSSLSIMDVRPADAGTYSVVVSGGSYTVTKLGSLTVNSATSATPLSSVTTCPGARATFATVAGGTGPFGFVWRKDGLELTGQTNNSLVISNVMQRDAGAYTVEVTGPCGTLSSSATLTLGGACLQATTIGLTGNHVVIGFMTFASQSYRVERADDLAGSPWVTVADQLFGTGGIVQVTDPGGVGHISRFYRVVLVSDTAGSAP